MVGASQRLVRLWRKLPPPKLFATFSYKSSKEYMNNTQLQQIVQAINKTPPKNSAALAAAVRKIAGQFNSPTPAKSALITAYQTLVKTKKIKPNPKLRKLLVKRAVRSLSGVSIITVLTKPFPCPGRCVYCPTDYRMPKSYLANEPAAQRALRNKFSPCLMVTNRIKALEANGHEVDKIELIVLGGTWSFYPLSYQNWFITQCFYAANTYGKKTKRKVKSLEAEQNFNQTAKYKIIGLTLETRPDYVNAQEIKRLRRLGCTRVQLGVQHTDNKILELIKRDDTLEGAVRATQMLKEVGLKVDHHYMPDLPGSTPKKDLAMFKYVFSGPELQPDQIKIYPCIVNEDAELYQWYKSGKYKPYEPKQLLNLLLAIKKIVPPYVRINRLIRDIPAESIVAGNKITNLRQYLKELSHKQGWSCQCLHCREVRDQAEEVQQAKLVCRTYRASAGTEHFFSFESPDQKKVYAFLRLRFNDRPQNNIFPELKNAALVRELHVYGQMIPVGSLDKGLNKNKRTQHRGFGSSLMLTAEELSQKNGYKKIAVISGIGVRNYYRKLGYKLEGTYLTKKLA